MPKKYIVCTKCKRILNKKELIHRENRDVCPFCGNDRFTTSFSNVFLIIKPEESNVAKTIQKKESGLFALTIEI